MLLNTTKLTAVKKRVNNSSMQINKVVTQAYFFRIVRLTTIEKDALHLEYVHSCIKIEPK